MAFVSAIISEGRSIQGDKRVIYGTYTNTSGSTGGDIVTSLSRVDGITITQTGSAITTGAPVVNESFPLSKGDVTIVTDADADGIWKAEGR